jgi:pSer/pThr/pTyr-binding forkhead associated (FHA) protein
VAELIKLVISDNEGTTTVVPFARDEVSIGRKEGNTIRLTERNVSREHCRIQRQNGSFSVRDLGSYNGVILNGKRVEGESPLKTGDELRVGDYTLQLEEEKPAEVVPEPDPTPVKRRSSAPPPRLVILTAPVAGAEFSLPERGELRIGRAPELDVTLDHRSVSREHAKIACEPGAVRIIDQGSVNGIVVNRVKVTEARLAPGDIVELGDVLVRFVGPGEHYVFDPAEVRALSAHRRAAVQKPQLIAAGLVGAALILAVLIVRGGGHKAPPAVQSSPEAAHTAVAEHATAGTVAAVAPVPAVEHFPELLDACRQAIGGGRFAEAVAHATAALKERPGAADALECQQTARADHEQEQIYVRGKAAEQAGDIEDAWKELATLDAHSSVSQRPEIAQEVAKVARARLQEGEHILKKQPDQAAAIAAAVLAAAGLPEPIAAQAQALAQHADKALTAKAARAEAAPRRAAPEPKARAAAPTAAAPRPAEKVDRTSPMEAASACLARGDNQCVIHALNGRAQTAQELGLLIETYRALGDTAQAYRGMTAYVQRFPTARRAEAYRQMLDRQGN